MTDLLQTHALLAELVDHHAPELTLLRRELHAHPEPSWEERRTTERLRARLEDAGLDARVAPTGTGVICDIGSAGPMVMIRGDIDALRMPDTKEVPYRSKVDGICHACGHDLHATVALGAGLVISEALAATGQEGRVRLILQPAEETVPGGATALVDAGVMRDVRAGFGLHADPSLTTGQVGLSAGAITSAADLLRIVVKGPGGHTARPHQTVDVVHVAARLVTELPRDLARRCDPRDGVNLTFGSVKAGDAPNVIPTEAVLNGSLRSGGRSAWDLAPELLARMVPAIAEPLGAQWELEHQRGAPPIMNDPWAISMVTRAAVSVLGEQGVVPTKQSAGGEDFSWYGEHAPVGFFRLGVRHPGAARTDLHASSFDVDEAAIPIGTKILAGAALEALAAFS